MYDKLNWSMRYSPTLSLYSCESTLEFNWPRRRTYLSVLTSFSISASGLFVYQILFLILYCASSLYRILTRPAPILYFTCERELDLFCLPYLLKHFTQVRKQLFTMFFLLLFLHHSMAIDFHRSNTPTPSRPPNSDLELRLYQATWLLRTKNDIVPVNKLVSSIRFCEK